MPIRPLALAALVALAPAALWAEDAHEDHDAHDDHAEDHADHLAEAGDLRLVHAWTRATAADHALVFVEIENAGATVMLTGAESPAAEEVTLVGFRMTGDGGTYEALPELPVAQGTELKLAPEGLALRLDGLAAPLAEGDTLPVHVRFGETHVEVTAQVEAADARQHSHAGHAH